MTDSVTSSLLKTCAHGELEHKCDICYLLIEVRCAHRLLRKCHKVLMNNEQEEFICLAQEIELDIDVEDQE